MTRLARRTAAIVAVVFGLATIAAGGRVLTGSDPGYIVFRPLLIYNTVMGVAYLSAGVAIWRSAHRGQYAAAAIFVLNLIVLGAIVLLYAAGRAIAVDSLGAMTFRTAVWLGLFLFLVWLTRRTGA